MLCLHQCVSVVCICACAPHRRAVQSGDGTRVFGKDLSENPEWYKWRRTPMTWLKLAKKHSESGHVALASDCFNEAARLRALITAQEEEDRRVGASLPVCQLK